MQQRPLRRGRRSVGRVALAAAITGAALALAPTTPAVAATATFTVNSLQHQVDANIGDGVCETSDAGECTFLAALQEANALPASPGDDISIVMDGALSGDIQPAFPGFQMETNPVGQNSSIIGPSGAWYVVEAQRPVTIDFGKDVRIVQSDDHGVAGIFVKSDDVTIAGFSLRAGEANFAISSSNVQLLDGECRDAISTSSEVCVALLDGATNVLVQDVLSISQYWADVYVDQAATVGNITLRFFDAWSSEVSSIWVGQGAAVADRTIVNGLSVESSRFRSGVTVDTFVQLDQFTTINDLAVTDSSFLGGSFSNVADGSTFTPGPVNNIPAIAFATEVETNGLTVTGTNFDYLYDAWRDAALTTNTDLTFTGNTFSHVLRHVLLFQSGTYENVLVEDNDFTDNGPSVNTTVWLRGATTNGVIQGNRFIQTDPGTTGNRWAIYSDGNAASPTSPLGWSILDNHFDGYFGASDAPITLLGSGTIPVERNTFGQGTRGSTNLETETGPSWFVANRTADVNHRIQTWRVTVAEFSPTTITATVAPVAPEASNFDATTPVDVDVYWSADDNAEHYLGRVSQVSAETTVVFPSTLGAGFVRAQTHDADGNSSQYSSAVEVVDDATPPAKPVITAAPAEGPIEGTGEPQATVTVRTAEGELVCSATVDADGGWSCDPEQPLPCGTQLVATQVDGAGNVSPASTPFSVAACPDATAPEAPTVKGVSVLGTIQGTGEPAATVTVTDQNGRTVCSTTVQPDGGWSCNPAAPLACGTTLAAHQTDAAGNVSPVSVRTSTGIPACPAGGGQLPATGSSSTLPMTMVAAGLLLAGLSLLGLRRSRWVRA